ncbi:MAG: nitrate- and nitrite sensing domain-containing protein [Cyclobacteriaceae bacterium]
MASIHNLSVKSKFALAILPLIIIIIVFDYLQIQEHYNDYTDSQRLNKAIVVGIEINHAVHELQKERSIATGFLSQEGDDFRQDLLNQRERTDSTIQAFYDEIEREELSDLVSLHSEELRDLGTYFDRIQEIRDNVDSRFISAEQVINYFSDINEAALKTVNGLISESRNRVAAEQVHAIIYFLKAKERASIERAIGTQAFSRGSLEGAAHSQFTSLIAEQSAFLDAFTTIADQASLVYFNNTVSGQDVVEVERLRLLLIQNQTLENDANYWYQMSTTKINLLKKAEDFMSVRIHDYTEGISAEANRSLYTVLIVDSTIALLTFIMIAFIVSHLLKDVETLEEFTKKVISGDLSQKVNIKTRDEIGHYADTFNIMITEIKKSQLALKKERDKARFLYENIYKQSQVVFENVEQGIFLLNREHKISRLYSKAMETIFGTKTIAGETLVNFMRTLLIPRDLEALEMFMKHLFNPEIDEDVVNQLNPVEQVKIFTESGGMVNTKYIRLAFTRIENKAGAIQQIMVTVTDETEGVLLQHKLEEADEKKKMEMEQMLSILKIDPALLRGFIVNSRKVLKSISTKYEEHDGVNFDELLTFTFQIIHNLKGNSIVIGLQILTDRFHKIEDGITKLKDNPKVVGNDFLTILYEINEVDIIVENMSDMLRKVANIYNKFSGEEQTDTNYDLIDSLKRGLSTMSEDTGKAINFSFTNDKNLNIPKIIQDPIKDVLIQLMRNSIAHGIEAPNVRIAQRKLIKGNIAVTLDENEVSDELILTYRDDGSGLNTAKIIEKAINKNILQESERDKLSEDQIVDLLFSDGFSTNDDVDEYSGRGHGLGVVKTKINELHGTFKVNFEKGVFFEIILKFPATVQNPIEE